MTYDKIYVLDTNIILNNSQNILELSEKSKNLIVLPETVLDEIDSKKSGFEEINFQARSFARLLQDAIINKKSTIQVNNQLITIIETEVQNCTFHIVSKEKYKADETSNKSIKNDRKILEITQDIIINEKYRDAKFISLDIMARTRALSLGIDTEALTLGKSEIEVDRDFHYEIEVEDYDGIVEDIIVPNHMSSLEVISSSGKHYIYFRNKQNMWVLISKDNENRMPVPPINKKQKIMSDIILDETDIICVAGVAGTGKTLIALSGAMRLIDLQEKYKKIYYLRRTVISGTKEDELGFMPGTLEEKMAGYNTPMEDSIKKVAQLKKRNATKEVIEEMVYNLKEKYDIEYLYAGHLRGSTLEDGSILILDECLSKNQTIQTNIGLKSIKEIESMIIKELDFKVLSYNIKEEKYEYKDMLSLKKEHILNTKEKMYKITLEDNSIIEVTGNHKLMINGRYQTINDIKELNENCYLQTKN